MCGRSVHSLRVLEWQLLACRVGDLMLAGRFQDIRQQYELVTLEVGQSVSELRWTQLSSASPQVRCKRCALNHKEWVEGRQALWIACKRARRDRRAHSS